MHSILNKTVASLGAAICFTSSVLAQDLPTPTIDAETRGFSIGMTSDQVLTQIQSEFPNARPRITNTRHQNSRQEFIYSIQVIADGEKLWFYFTGHFSGNRLFSLKREAKFKAGNRPSAVDTRQQLLAKYGLPTRAGGHTLFYNYDTNDVVLLGSDDEIQSLINVDKWESYGFSALAKAKGLDSTASLELSRCSNTIEFIQNGRSYTPLNPKLPFSDMCTGAMTIETPAVDGLLAALEVNIGDYRFVVESARIDQASDTKPTQQPSEDKAKL